MSAKPHTRIPVGVVVERRKATSPWLDIVWRPVAVLGGVPDAAPWTALANAGDVATFYVGAAEIEGLLRIKTGVDTAVDRRGAAFACHVSHLHAAQRWEEMTPATTLAARSIATYGQPEQALGQALDFLRGLGLVR